jgi:hypothetical protein
LLVGQLHIKKENADDAEKNAEDFECCFHEIIKPKIQQTEFRKKLYFTTIIGWLRQADMKSLLVG